MTISTKNYRNLPEHQQGNSQAKMIAALLFIGIMLAGAILMMDKGKSVKKDDGDGPQATNVASAEKNKQGTQHEANRVTMDEAQVKASAIDIASAGPAHIASLVQFPGEVLLNDDRTVHVVPRVPGIVEAVLVSTGQTVKKGQLLAIFSSQTISEQRSHLQTAQKRLGFASTVYEREKKLWEQKITAEQDYLQALQVKREAEIEVENAQQKLSALGVGSGSSALNRFELRAPYDGLVVERNLSIGEAVKEDAAIFTIADMSTVWAEVQLPAKDLPLMHVGGKVTIRATAFDAQATGTVAFIGALVGEQTRMAKARILLANPKGGWRPGLFVNVEVRAEDVNVPVAIESEALQTLGTQQVIFIRDDKGFVAHPVTPGRSDGQHIEISQGLPAGTRYAARGSYIIKSELSKLATEDGY